MNLNNLRGQLSSRGSLSGGLTAGAGGTSDYDELENKPQINGRELIDNQTGHELELANLTDVSDLAADVALLSQRLPRNYSTDEQATGQHWIDGKMIYQKTMFALNVNGNTNIAPLPKDFDKLIKCDGANYIINDDEWVINGYYSNNYYMRFYVYNGYFYIECSPNNLTRNVYITAYYTKNE